MKKILLLIFVLPIFEFTTAETIKIYTQKDTIQWQKNTAVNPKKPKKRRFWDAILDVFGFIIGGSIIYGLPIIGFSALGSALLGLIFGYDSSSSVFYWVAGGIVVLMLTLAVIDFNKRQKSQPFIKLKKKPKSIVSKKRFN
jgi:cytochrome c biogenesis protein CcdA